MIEGILLSAGFEGKYFKATIRTSKGDWKRDIPVVGIQTKAMQLIGQRVQAAEEKNVENNYKHISDIRAFPVEGAKAGAGGPGKFSKYTEDQVGLQKCRCSMIEAACTLFSGSKTVTSDHIIAAAKAFERYVFESTLADEAAKLGAEPEEMPF